MIYLDNAATSFPKPDAVYDRVTTMLHECGNPGRSSHRLAMLSEREVFACRAAAAEMFGSAPERVVFTCNATAALNMAIKCGYTGGSILISDLEHNSVRRPALAAADRAGENVLIFDSHAEMPDGEERAAEILASIRSKLAHTAKCGMLVSTAASNICGVRMPLREIGRLCRERGMLFVVDASQAAGHTDIDTRRDNIDVLCMPGHKGLYGPQGTGMMILGEGIALKNSFIEGGSGVDSLSPGMPDEPPERYEAGTLAVPCIAGLLAGIEFVASVGTADIREHESRLAEILKSGLRERLGGRVTFYGDGHPGGILLFDISGYSPSDIGGYLDRNGVAVRSGYHCAPLAHRKLGTKNGAVRASFGWFNTEDDARDTAEILGRLR